MVTIKIRYKDYDVNEFTNEQSVNLDSLLEIFENHTKLIATNRSYTINRIFTCFYLQNGQNYMRICHIGKDAFSVVYLNEYSNKSFSCNYYKNSILCLLKYFYENEREKLLKEIPISNELKTNLMKDFITFDFVYRYKNKLSGFFIFDVIFFSILLIILLIKLISMWYSSGIILLILIIPSLILLIFLIRIEKNYIKYSINKTIKISSGSENIIINENNKEIVFQKKDIKIVNYFFASGGRNFFADYDWTLIKLNNGSKFIIPNKIINPYELKNKLKKINSLDEAIYYNYIRRNYLNDKK